MLAAWRQAKRVAAKPGEREDKGRSPVERSSIDDVTMVHRGEGFYGIRNWRSPNGAEVIGFMPLAQSLLQDQGKRRMGNPKVPRWKSA